MWPDKKGSRWRALLATQPLARWVTLDMKMGYWDASEHQRERLAFWDSMSSFLPTSVKDEL